MPNDTTYKALKIEFWC